MGRLERLSNAAPFWTRLQRVQRELKHGTPATQDTALNGLRDSLESRYAGQLFPSFVYPQLQQTFCYYCEKILPQLSLGPGDQALVRDGFSRTIKQLAIRKQQALAMENTCRRLLSRLRNRQFTSIREFIDAFSVLLDADVLPYASLPEEARLGKAFTQLKRAPFTSAQLLPFFEMLLPGGLPEVLQSSFRKIGMLFWDQLQEQLQMKVVLVNPDTRRARLTRLEIETRLQGGGSDELLFVPDTVDDRMYSSCLNAVQAVREYMTARLPGLLAGKSLQVSCRFADPLPAYFDSSASLAVAVKLAGDLLDLEIAPQIVLSGEIDETGRLVPVRFLWEKIAQAEENPHIREFWFAEGGEPVASDVLRLRGVRELAGTLESYYGKPLQQALQAQRRRSMAFERATGPVCSMSQNTPSPETRQRHKRPLAYSTRPHVGHFVGREAQLAHLKEELRDRNTVFMLLDGLAGIGKTTLAAKLAEDVEDEFCGVYWTKCTAYTDLDQILAELAYFLSEHGDQTFSNVFSYNIPKKNKLDFLISSLGEPVPISLDGENLPFLRGAKKGFLLIFDDLHELLGEDHSIRDPDLAQLFTQLLSQSHHSKVLLLSRIRPQFSRHQGSQSKNSVESISEEGSLHLLRQLGLDDDEALLRQAYRLTAGHPLALELLASLTEIMPLEELLEDRRIFWSEAAVIEQLLQELDAALSREEHELLSTISILPRPADREIMKCLTGRANITPLVASLSRKALLSYDRAQKIYKLHDLVRDFYRLQMDEAQTRAIHLKAADYYERQTQGRTDKMTFQEVEQQLSAHHHYFEAGEYEKAAEILTVASKYLREWGYIERNGNLLTETLQTLKNVTSTKELQTLKLELTMELSWVESISQNLEQAIKRCQRAERELEVREAQLRGNLYHALGNFFYYKALWNEADNYLIKAFSIRKEEDDLKGIVRLLKDFYKLYWGWGQTEKIEALCSEGIEICKRLGDVESHVEILMNVLGNTFEEQRRLDKSLTVYQKSLSLRKANDFVGKALSLSACGQVLRHKRKFNEALENYKESLKLIEGTKHFIAQASVLRGLGNTYRDEGNLEDALKIYGKAVELVKKSDNLQERTEFLMKIARSYGNSGKLDKHQELIEECLDLKKQSGDIVGMAHTLNNLGFFYEMRFSNLAKALECYQKSIKIKKELGRAIEAELTMGNLADVYRKQGRFDEALKILKGLLQLREVRKARRMIILNTLGNTYYDMQEYPKALCFLQQSSSERNQSLYARSYTLMYLAHVYTAIGNYEKALIASKESLDLQVNLYLKASPITNIANVYYHKNELVEAMEKCKESLVFSRTYGGRIQSGITLHLMAKISLKTSCIEEALSFTQEAAQIFKETGSFHLPEAEATLKELQELKGSKTSGCQKRYSD